MWYGDENQKDAINRRNGQRPKIIEVLLISVLNMEAKPKKPKSNP